MNQNNNELAPLGVFSVRNYTKDGRPRQHWLRIGMAFPNKDGSFNISLWASPLPDRTNNVLRLYVRPIKHKDDGNQTSQNTQEVDVVAENGFYLDIDPLWGAPLEAL